MPITFEIPAERVRDGGEILIRILAPTTRPRTPSPGDPGIDVSRHQGEVDWDAMRAAGIVFAGIRATMGATGKDDQFARNWQHAKRVGILRLVYHYFINGMPAMGQVDNLFESLKDDLGELPIVLDVEPRKGEVVLNKTGNTQAIAEWLARVEVRSGKTPIIYTNGPAWQACTTNPHWAANFPLWLAQYNSLPQPKVPAPWSRYAIWQYSATGNVGGKAPLDLNRWGTL